MGALAQTPEQGYKLLLTPQHLRRLQRDHERNTIRWQNFEHRVETVPDSPERGFELALYYAVTRDEARGREAVQWAKAHPCDARQVSLIREWTGELWKDIPISACVGSGPITIQSFRNELFTIVASGQATVPRNSLNGWEGRVLTSPSELYALCEYLITVRTLTHNDLRQDDASFFRVLPKEFLLSLKPEQIEHPNWMEHIAALALVAVDPNLEGSQFLQGWAMEENQMISEGPGVAYEFLWADPYLPGIAYRNLDPWAYDPAGRLFARTGWDANPCWLAMDSNGLRTENCPAGVQERQQTFGSLTLLPMSGPCVDLPARTTRDSLILWQMKPGQAVAYHGEKKKDFVETTDAAGMWLVPENANGRVCEQRPRR